MNCPDHPRYQVKRKPSGNCESCWAIWLERQADGGLLDYANDHTKGKDDAILQRLKDDLRLARAAQNVAIKRAVKAERVKEAVFGLTKSGGAEPPRWLIQKSIAKDIPHIPILVTSDFHFGEVITKEAMGGTNEFNMAIAERRYRTLIEKTVDIGLSHLNRNNYEGIILLRLGDTVSGDIHDELLKTNAMPALPVCREVKRIEQGGIEQLADAFGQVYVVSVPGNHGRLTRKKESKGTVTQSYDSLISWWLEDSMSENSAVTFDTPESGDALFDVFGRTYFATHGDRMGGGGGGGFIGPAAAIMKGMKKIVDSQAHLGKTVHKIFIGHYHTPYDLDYGWSNGSLPGYSELGRDHRYKPEAPVQWLIFMHPRYGTTSTWQVMTAPQPKSQEVRTPFRK